MSDEHGKICSDDEGCPGPRIEFSVGRETPAVQLPRLSVHNVIIANEDIYSITILVKL
jgi:hypothetical protein